MVNDHAVHRAILGKRESHVITQKINDFFRIPQ